MLKYGRRHHASRILHLLVGFRLGRRSCACAPLLGRVSGQRSERGAVDGSMAVVGNPAYPTRHVHSATAQKTMMSSVRVTTKKTPGKRAIQHLNQTEKDNQMPEKHEPKPKENARPCKPPEYFSCVTNSMGSMFSRLLLPSTNS